MIKSQAYICVCCIYGVCSNGCSNVYSDDNVMEQKSSSIWKDLSKKRLFMRQVFLLGTRGVDSSQKVKDFRLDFTKSKKTCNSTWT